MSTDWGPWAWVAAAWIQLVVAYVGYAAYLRRRSRRSVGGEDGES